MPPSDAPAPIPSLSPRDGRVKAELPAMDEAGARRAVAAAREAQRAWAALPVRERAAALMRVRRRFLENAERFVALLVEENGKPEAEAWTSEIVANGDLISWWAKHAAGYLKPEKLSLSPINYPGKRARIEYVPRGVVAVISPWNFPVAIPLRNIVPALLAGNAVVFKPSSACPRIGQLIGETFAAELPAGLLPVILGPGSLGSTVIEAGADFVSFTGSVGVGRKVGRLCAERFVPFALELGGKDAAIVLADADLERAARGVAWGGFTNCGQNCASIERVYVERAVAEPFVARLVALTRGLRRGEDYGPLTTEAQRTIVEGQVSEAIAAGAKLETGGRRGEGEGFWYEPTILTGVADALAVMTEETFGPVLPIRVVEDAEEALRLANDSRFGLTASVWTRDPARGEALAARLEVGVVTVNNHSFTGALPFAPWSGTKETGTGVTNSHLALKELVRPRMVLVDRSRKPDLWWYPYNEALIEASRALRDLALGRWSALGRLISAFRRRFD